MVSGASNPGLRARGEVFPQVFPRARQMAMPGFCSRGLGGEAAMSSFS